MLNSTFLSVGFYVIHYEGYYLEHVSLYGPLRPDRQKDVKFLYQTTLVCVFVR
jgi:hypothetical protein